MGSVAADLQADLFACVQRGDWEAARRVNDRLDPLVRVFYAAPFLDMQPYERSSGPPWAA
jgi:4-hydroxy-tetrahydrodipicolinate synthase